MIYYNSRIYTKCMAMCMFLDRFFINEHQLIFSSVETHQQSTSCFNLICYFEHTLANKVENSGIFTSVNSNIF